MTAKDRAWIIWQTIQLDKIERAYDRKWFGIR